MDGNHRVWAFLRPGGSPCRGRGLQRGSGFCRVILKKLEAPTHPGLLYPWRTRERLRTANFDVVANWGGLKRPKMESTERVRRAQVGVKLGKLGPSLVEHR